jgi:hypothetical protein
MKIGVVEFCTVPLVATSQKTHVMPLLALKKWKMYFYVEIQKTLVTKVVGLVIWFNCEHSHVTLRHA